MCESMHTKTKTLGSVNVFQRSVAPLAGGGEPPVQRDMEEDPEKPAVQLSATTQLRLHLTGTFSDLVSTITFHSVSETEIQYSDQMLQKVFNSRERLKT